MKKHFVTFYSPGTFCAESSTKEIDSWDVEQAKEMAHKITQRYGATPYGFRFSTWSRGPNDLDSKETATSNFYYLGGIIETIDDVRKRNDPDERTLLRNMESNSWNRIVVNNNSYRWTQPLNKGDVVLDWKPRNKDA